MSLSLLKNDRMIRRDCMMQRPLTCVEICAGAGGQALGLAMAGFVHVALVEYEADYCEVLRKKPARMECYLCGCSRFRWTAIQRR